MTQRRSRHTRPLADVAGKDSLQTQDSGGCTTITASATAPTHTSARHSPAKKINPANLSANAFSPELINLISSSFLNIQTIVYLLKRGQKLSG